MATAAQNLCRLTEKIFEDGFRREEFSDEDWNAMIDFWENTKAKALKGKEENQEMTENGKAVLAYMQENVAEPATSKEIAAGMGISSRSVSGAMRKLISTGYVEKEENTSPIHYNLTELGKEYII